MSSIVAFARLRPSPIGSTNSAGKPYLPAGQVLSSSIDILPHDAFDPWNASLISGK